MVKSGNTLAGDRRCARAAASAALLFVGVQFAHQCLGAETYVSQGPDGTPRYASQPWDATYVPLEGGKPFLGAGSGSKHSASRGLNEIVRQVASRHGVREGLVRSVISIESGYDANARSHKGAHGLMQLMPQTAARYGVIDPGSLVNPTRNVDVGTRHLKVLLEHYGGNEALALAAYNAGAASVRRHGNRIPPFRETMLYVPAVLASESKSRTP